MTWLYVLLMLLGLGIRAWVIMNNPGFSLYIKRPPGIYQRGLYAHVRHPAYLGSLIMTAGLFAWCLGGFIPAFPAWFVLWVLLTHTARHEEVFLCTQYPEYEGYMRRTGMLLPRLWGRA